MSKVSKYEQKRNWTSLNSLLHIIKINGVLQYVVQVAKTKIQCK